jgi:hypothetical protein
LGFVGAAGTGLPATNARGGFGEAGEKKENDQSGEVFHFLNKMFRISTSRRSGKLDFFVSAV